MRYLCISFLRKMNGQIDEMISIAKSLKQSDIKNSNVILDFALNKVVKCIIEGKEQERTFDQLVDYYSRIYPQLIDQLRTEAPIVALQEKQNTKLSKLKKQNT